MKVLIIGASGLVGSNFLRHFRNNGWKVLGTYFSYPAQDTFFFDTLNLDNPGNADLDAFSPDVIVHCGALTHVDYCEEHPDESRRLTVNSTQNVLQLALRYHAKLVFISTDYIFDGHEGPYDEQAIANPISVYGRHKWEAEQLVAGSGLDHLILRITNVYGDEERGKNFVARIMEQASKGQKLSLKLPVDQYATPVNAHDVARAAYLLLKDGHSGIFNIASTDYMNRVQLALRILRYFPNAAYDLHPMITRDLGQPAPRPLQGGLKSAKFLAMYPDFVYSTIDEYVSSKTKGI